MRPARGCIHPAIHPSTHISIYLYIHLSIHTSMHLPIYLSIHPPVYPSIYLSVHQIYRQKSVLCVKKLHKIYLLLQSQPKVLYRPLLLGMFIERSNILGQRTGNILSVRGGGGSGGGVCERRREENALCFAGTKIRDPREGKTLVFI